jgi:acyl-CoA synthetase (NDP forming)
MFQACGIPQAWSIQLPIDTSTLADRALDDIKFPVVAKIVSRDIAHKTDCGGVVLNLTSVETLNAAYEEMLKNVRRNRPSARLDGIQVQTMERGLAEVLVGYRRDPQVGPTITLAMGGVLAEIYRDSVTFLAPVTKTDARKMVDSVRGLAILRGYRGLPLGDLDALAEAVVNLSSLAIIDNPKVLEAEINPLLVKGEGEGVVAVDALVTWENLSVAASSE